MRPDSARTLYSAIQMIYLPSYLLIIFVKLTAKATHIHM